jgi:general secretion pathway protein A
LQIVLVGQPELDEKLDSIGLRQLKQRIAVRTQLGPLDADETKRYIKRRLEIAGADPDSSPLFSEEAVARVYRHSRGLPRLINTLCENALITTYARRLPSVTPEVIEDVAKEFRLDVIGFSETATSESHNEDVQRAIKVLIDLYPALRRTIASNSDLGTPVPVEVSKHEPNI